MRGGKAARENLAEIVILLLSKNEGRKHCIAQEIVPGYSFAMSSTVSGILQEALSLRPSDRASLAEKIIESIGADVEPEIQKAHLQEIRRRRDQVVTGRVQLVPGDEALTRARATLRK